MDPATGASTATVSGWPVAIRADRRSPSAGSGAATRIGWTRSGGQAQYTPGPRNQQRVRTFTPPTPRLTVTTTYSRQADHGADSAYGAGTRPADRAGGRTSLRHHEGSHGGDYLDFFRRNPPPQFTGATGMTRAQYNQALNQWHGRVNALVRRADRESELRTDCVGTTIDQHRGGHSNVCAPRPGDPPPPAAPPPGTGSASPPAAPTAPAAPGNLDVDDLSGI